MAHPDLLGDRAAAATGAAVATDSELPELVPFTPTFKADRPFLYLIRDNEWIAPGDVFVTNDPYRGGSHLPDITVVTPCFSKNDELVFWVASRAHHAE